LAYKCFWIFITALIVPLISQAEIRDPTKPFSPIQIEKSVNEHEDELIVSAIWITPKSRRVTINGISAKPGQIILNGVKIIRIQHNSVTLQQNGVIKSLQLIQRPFIKPAKSDRRLIK
jgi:hypothetical protein